MITKRTYKRSIEGVGEISVVLDRAQLALSVNDPLNEGCRMVDLQGKAAEAIAIATYHLVMADARYRSRAARVRKAADGTQYAANNEVEASDWFLDVKADVADAQAALEFAKGFQGACRDAARICEEMSRAQGRTGERLMTGRVDVGDGDDPRGKYHRESRQEVAARNRDRKENGHG